MSGGHWNYGQHQMESFLNDVARDSAVKERFPKLAKRFEELASALGKVAHDLDWDLSYDSTIKDDAEFEDKALLALVDWQLLNSVGEVSAKQPPPEQVELARKILDGDDYIDPGDAERLAQLVLGNIDAAEEECPEPEPFKPAPKYKQLLIHCCVHCPFRNVEYDWGTSTCKLMDEELEHNTTTGVDPDCPLKKQSHLLTYVEKEGGR